MTVIASIFLDINLPNPTTWFYFSGLLTVALFFKFSRLLSMRNLDIVTLFLPMAGFLLLLEGDHVRDSGDRSAREARHARELADRANSDADRSRLQAEADSGNAAADRLRAESARFSFLGYLWLLCSSLYFLVRCLLDLALVRRPALSANLDLGGLAWLGGALFVSLIAVAVRQPGGNGGADRSAATTDKVASATEKAIKPVAANVGDADLTLWVERGLALVCHLSVAVGLVLVGWLHFADLRAGMSAATFYLLLPYTYLLLPNSPQGLGRWDHAWAMALMIWAVFTYRRPLLAGTFLGLATGLTFFPVLTLPVWVGFYRRAGVARFALAFALSIGLCLAIFGMVLWLNDELPSSLRSAWTESAWQPWKRPDPGTRGFWQDIPSERVYRAQAAYRLPVFLASMALVVLTAFWPTPKNLAHVLALSAAVLIGIQFWYADRGGTYVFWYLPFLLLLVFRPNLADVRPPPPPEDDWLARLGRRLHRMVLRWLRRPAPAVRAG